jgi:hypothetical protein
MSKHAMQGSSSVPLAFCCVFFAYSSQMQHFLSHMSFRFYRIPNLRAWYQKHSEDPTCACETCAALDVDLNILSKLKAGTSFFTFRHMVDVLFTLQGSAGFDTRFSDPITDIMLFDVENLSESKIRSMLKSHSAMELVKRSHFLIDCFKADPLAKENSIKRVNDALLPYVD